MQSRKQKNLDSLGIVSDVVIVHDDDLGFGDTMAFHDMVSMVGVGLVSVVVVSIRSRHDQHPQLRSIGSVNRRILVQDKVADGRREDNGGNNAEDSQ